MRKMSKRERRECDEEFVCVGVHTLKILSRECCAEECTKSSPLAISALSKSNHAISAAMVRLVSNSLLLQTRWGL